MATSPLQMLSLWGKTKPQSLTVSGGALWTAVATLHVGLWVKQKATYGRALKTLFCFSASENGLGWKARIAHCKLEGLCSS